MAKNTQKNQLECNKKARKTTQRKILNIKLYASKLKRSMK